MVWGLLELGPGARAEPNDFGRILSKFISSDRGEAPFSIEIMTSTFKIFNIKFAKVIEPLGSSADVALASIYGNFVLVLPTEPDEDSPCPRVICILSTLVHEEPFRAPGRNGRPRFSMKAYSENAGVLEQLETLGIVSRTGISYNQGFVNIPVVEVCLEENQLIHACATHYENCGLAGCRFEVVGTKYPRCSKCKQMYYCNQEVSSCIVISSLLLIALIHELVPNASLVCT